MKSEPIVAAQLALGDDGVPTSPQFGDRYHPRQGALLQARHVFLAGNGLPQRWAGRERFVVLETGFGLGNNFLATWAAWRADPSRCARLHLVSVERHPPSRADLAAVAREPELAALAPALVDAWPPLVHGLHRLAFEDGRVELLLAFGDAAAWLPELMAAVDAVFLDGFAPDRNPALWQPRLMAAIARRAVPGTTAATWSAARSVRDALAGAGFAVRREAGAGGKRDITCATYAPAHVPRRAPAGRPQQRDVEARALIVGGGLAGCAAARALAQHGWRSTVFDRHATPAQEGSGNPAGLFHGIVNAEDGAHARWNRAAALQARELVLQATAGGSVRSSVAGLLRLAGDELDLPAMRKTIARLGLPADYVEALDAAEASRRAGLALDQPAWFYPGGGWVEPAALARWLLDDAGALVDWRGGVVVDSLQRRGERWALCDAQGGTIAESASVVLASAGDVLRLLGRPAWPLESLRGQLSEVGVADFVAAGGTPPRLPIAGAGYLLPALDGRIRFGATAQAGDTDAAVRRRDHEDNLMQLRRLTGAALPLAPDRLIGRVGWRCSSVDRLPLIGAVPALATPVTTDQPRFVAREPGLFVLSALGSRGITWAALAGRLLAAWVTGAPAPVEASLLEAVDPARFAARETRRRASIRPRPAPARPG